MQALDYSRATHHNNPQDLDLMEDLLRSRPADDNQLLAVAQDPQQSQLVRNTAGIKLLRQELHQAAVSLAKNDLVATERALAAVKTQLAQPSGSAPRNRFVLQYIDLCIETARRKGEQNKADDLTQVRKAIIDPNKAQRWYQSEGIAGFETDYSPAFRAQYWMHSCKYCSWKSESKGVSAAVDSCADKSAPESLALAVLLESVIRASSHKDQALLDHIYSVWSDRYSGRLPSTKEEGWIIPALSISAIRANDPAKAIVYLNRYLDLIENHIITEKQHVGLLTGFESWCAMAGLILRGPSHDKEVAQVCARAQQLATKEGINDASIQLTQSVLLIQSGQYQKALEQLHELVRNPAARALRIGDSSAVIAEINHMHALVNASEADQRFARAVVDDALQLNNWTDDELVQLLILKADSAAKSPLEAKETNQWSDAFGRLKQLSKTGKLSRGTTSLLDEYILRSLAWHNKLAEAQINYDSLKRKFANERAILLQLNIAELGRLRALPSLYEDAKKDHTYPQPAFYDTIDLAKELRGTGSTEYKSALLWVAQYELCRDNKEKSLQLVNKLLAANDKQSTTYWPAILLKAELTGDRLQLPSARVSCKAGSIAELNCAASLFYTSKHYQAHDNAKKLAKQIDEL